MEPDRQHLRRHAAFGVERVERILEIGVELVAAIEALGAGEAHVVRIERIGNHELRAARPFEPVRQIVGVSVGAIDEAALLHAETDGVERRAALIEAERAGACDLGMDAHRFGDMARLDVGRRVAIIDPLEAVGGDFPARLVHRLNRLAIARHRHRHRIDGDGNRAVGEQTMQAPEPGPGAVFVDRLHVHMPHARPGLSADDLGQERFGGGVAVQDVVLAALLVIDDELDRDARLVRPVGERRGAPIADHVARIGFVGHRVWRSVDRTPHDATTGRPFAPARRTSEVGVCISARSTALRPSKPRSARSLPSAPHRPDGRQA